MEDTAKKIKLTPKQAEVISLMRDGWELGTSNGFHGSSHATTRVSLQKGGIGKGGYSMHLKSCTTVDKLTAYGLIEINKKAKEENKRSPYNKYMLTELGKTIRL